MTAALFITLVTLLWLGLGYWLRRFWQASPRRWWLLWSLTGLTSCGLYALTGSPQLLGQQQVAEAPTPPPFIRQLQERLTKNPQDTEALVQLAEAQLTIQRPAEAVELYRRAVLASRGDLALILRYSEVQVLAAEGEVSDTAAEGFRIVQQIEPKDISSRFYLGLYHRQKGEDAARDRYWQGLKEELPKDHPWQTVIAGE